VLAPRPRGSALRALCWLASLALLAAYVCVFARYAVNYPRVDDYSQLLAVPYYVSLEPTVADALRYLFSLSVEHRIATLRLAALAQARLFGQIDFVALMVAGAVMLACGLALVVAQAPRAHRAWIALVAVALFISPAHYEAQYWATGALQHEGVIGLAFAALWLVARRSPMGNAAGFALACAAALTSANGIMTFPAAAVLLWQSGQRRTAAAAAVVSIVAFAVYFAGFDASGAGSHAVANPLQIVYFMLLGAGSLAIAAGPSAIGGGALFAVWAWLILTRARVPPLLAAWAFFLAASFAAMAAGRSELGEDAALLSRYRVYSGAFALVTLSAVLSVIVQQARLAVGIIAVPVSLAWLVASTNAAMPLVVNTWYAQEITRATYLSTGHGVYVPWPPQEYGDFMLDRAAAMGYFKAQASTHLPLPAQTPDTWNALRCCWSKGVP